MALDKQRILHELGSVVNQLQSADCGCIGKLFSNPNQQSNNMGSPLPMMTPQSHGGCRHSCCHNHGSCGSSGGDPYGQMQQVNQAPCMGHCNPPKLYADTYGYLNQNLMQPIVKEVYDDLRTITPANTMTNNNVLASQMGLSAQGNSPNMGYSGNTVGMAQHGASNGLQSMGMSQITGGANCYAGNSANEQQTGYNGNQQQMGQMAGMGPDIVKMIMGDSKPSKTGQQMKLTEPMVLDAPQSPHGKIGVTPLGTNQAQYNMQNPGMMQGMQAQQGMKGFTDPQMKQEVNLAENHLLQPNMKSPSMGGAQPNLYGQHTQGVKKFNEMFPGVMQGLGGDSLGFDPMAIAIQMNPANQHKSAVDNMHKMLMGQNALKAANQGVMPGTSNKEPVNAGIVNNNQMANNLTQPNEEPSAVSSQGQDQIQQQGQKQMQQQQIYSAVGQSTFANQQQAPTDNAVDQYQLSQAQGDQPTKPAMQEAILPADTSRNQAQKYFEYNTLGQPVELLPADCYKQPMEGLPQTLSPQPVPMKSNVKSTVSKTSLMGNKPVGRTPSRSQLQQIYYQYKGSQSNTQQNVRTNQGNTQSEGRLNTKLERIPEGAVEKVGGDTAVNNTHEININSVKRQVGDAPVASKAHGDVAQLRDSAPMGKGRNGLQDVVFTSYPTSTAWSFHGNKAASPYAYRYNNMNQQRNYRNAA